MRVKIPIEYEQKYFSCIKELVYSLNEIGLIVDIVYNNNEQVYLALIALGPDTPDRFPSGRSLSQKISCLDELVNSCGLKLTNIRENYSEGEDDFSAELLMCD